ncbi:hypothetical protein HMPREF9428_01002 [Citrobacter portucalensis]|nr:hypothetical protein HMPREF9428_01002 [Citrobacter portucalensis]
MLKELSIIFIALNNKKITLTSIVNFSIINALNSYKPLLYDNDLLNHHDFISFKNE